MMMNWFLSGIVVLVGSIQLLGCSERETIELLKPADGEVIRPGRPLALQVDIETEYVFAGVYAHLRLQPATDAYWQIGDNLNASAIRIDTVLDLPADLPESDEYEFVVSVSGEDPIEVDAVVVSLAVVLD